MPLQKSHITELGTALGLRFPDLPQALRTALPDVGVVGLDQDTWQELRAGSHSPENQRLLSIAFENGRFLQEVVMRRPALSVEWLGQVRQPFHADLPVDLRADEVYLVSCKYGSRILHNLSPAALFVGLLSGARRRGNPNWFQQVSPESYRRFYRACAEYASSTNGGWQIPPEECALSENDRRELAGCLQPLPSALEPEYRQLCREVSDRSAARWNASIDQYGDRLHMLWRLLRISSAQYYLLGAVRTEPVRIKVQSTMDWRRSYSLQSFTVSPADVGQPRVNWGATVLDRAHRRSHTISGHVEVRWSHGKFLQPPEAKVYLDSDLRTAPGYVNLVSSPSRDAVSVGGSLELPFN